MNICAQELELKIAALQNKGNELFCLIGVTVLAMQVMLHHLTVKPSNCQ